MEPLALTHLLDFARAHGLSDLVESDLVAGDIAADVFDFAANEVIWALQESGTPIPENLAAELREEFSDDEDILELLAA